MPVGCSAVFKPFLAFSSEDDDEPRRENKIALKKCERDLVLGPGSIPAPSKVVSLELSAGNVWL
jgi:hypothetical protein